VHDRRIILAASAAKPLYRGWLVIAAAFIGPYVDPVRNKWAITFGLVACAGVMPLALIAGSTRGIPLP